MEGLGGDARELRDLWVGQARVAFVERQAHDRAEDPRALLVACEERRRHGRAAGAIERRGHTQARSGGRAVGLDPLKRFVGKRVQLALAVLEQASEDDVTHAANDSAGGQSREADAVRR
jgi:hypothetical protein